METKMWPEDVVDSYHLLVYWEIIAEKKRVKDSQVESGGITEGCGEEVVYFNSQFAWRRRGK